MTVCVWLLAVLIVSLLVIIRGRETGKVFIFLAKEPLDLLCVYLWLSESVSLKGSIFVGALDPSESYCFGFELQLMFGIPYLNLCWLRFFATVCALLPG